MVRVAALILGLLCCAACKAGETPTTVDGGNDAGERDAQIGVDAATDVETSNVNLPGHDLVEGCNPVAHEVDCLLPYPSDFFRQGGLVARPDTAAPKDKNGAPVQGLQTRTADGFSVHPSILFHFGTGLDPASLLPLARVDESVLTTSPTLLLDTQTGEAIPHFSEVFLGEGPELQIGAIRPLSRLQDGRRYVVAVRGARTVEGTDVETPAVFEALRDQQPVDPRLSELAARFETDVFGPLETFGVDRTTLDLAWDFTTRSTDDLMSDMLDVSAGAMTWLETNTPTVTITEVREGADLPPALVGNSFRHVEGTFTAPLWTETDAPLALLGGERGDRQIVGTIDVPFSITIPLSISSDPTNRPARFLQFGHGFFGGREEVLSEVQSDFGNDFAFVMGAVDWSGMTRADRNAIVPAIVESPNNAFSFVPRVHQGISNQLVFTEVIRQQLGDQEALTLDRAPVYDPDQVYFFGISQGHILGGTLMAMSRSLERAALNAGGGSIGFILTRSYAFVLFRQILGQWFEPLELLKFEAVATEALEVIDPVTFAPLVLSANSIDRQVLLQAGVGDAAIPNLATAIHARALGIPLVAPSPVTLPFIEEVAAPAASGITFFDFGVDPLFATEWAPINMDTETHEAVRRFGGARLQIDRFLRPDGLIEDTCNGPCVVE